MAKNRICSIDGCNKPVRSRGWCGMHYMRWYQHGDPHTKLNRFGESAKFLEYAATHLDKCECLQWPFARSSKGYGRHHTQSKRIAAHRLVCEMAHGPAPTQQHVVAHSCGRGYEGCVNPHHLRWATHKENHADKQIHGTVARGEKNGNAKMTEGTVREIRRMIGTMTQQAIADRLGVTRSSVRDVKSGKTWAWVK